jgi:branched-chain amino acid transport system ATP-binding protein
VALLELAKVYAGYGSVPVLHGVTLTVEEGEIVALLGPNGAGKTTILRTIAGLVRPISGSVSLAGHGIGGLAPEAVAAAGIQFIPEGGGVLRDLSVLENLRLSGWRSARRASAAAPRLQRAFELFPLLAERCGQLASTLSGGERQMLALAQAMMTDAPVLLVDEASLGLAPRLLGVLFDAISRLRTHGRSILLVEQNAHIALDISDRAYVMEKGRIVDHGSAADAASHGRLAGLYLGDFEATP